MPKEIINFYRELVSVQKKQQPLVKVDLEKINLDVGVKEGKALLAQGAKIEFEIEEFREVVAQVLNTTQEYRPEVKEELEKIQNIIACMSSNELEKLIHNFITHQNLLLDEKTEKETEEINSDHS